MGVQATDLAGQTALDSAERSWLKQALLPQYGVTTLIAEGFLLKVWKSGPDKGEAKTPPPVARMVERGLLVVKPAGSGQRAYLTAKGVQALKRAFVSGQLTLQEFGDLQEQLGDNDETPVAHRSTPPDLRRA